MPKLTKQNLNYIKKSTEQLMKDEFTTLESVQEYFMQYKDIEDHSLPENASLYTITLALSTIKAGKATLDDYPEFFKFLPYTEGQFNALIEDFDNLDNINEIAENGEISLVPSRISRATIDYNKEEEKKLKEHIFGDDDKVEYDPDENEFENGNFDSEKEKDNDFNNSLDEGKILIDIKNNQNNIIEEEKDDYSIGGNDVSNLLDNPISIKSGAKKHIIDHAFMERMMGDGYIDEYTGLDLEDFYVTKNNEEVSMNASEYLQDILDNKKINDTPTEVALNKLEVYFALENRSARRSWFDVLKHPINSFQEWKMKNNLKNDIKATYHLNDEALLDIKNVVDNNLLESTYGGYDENGQKVVGDYLNDEIKNLNKMTIVSKNLENLEKDSSLDSSIEEKSPLYMDTTSLDKVIDEAEIQSQEINKN